MDTARVLRDAVQAVKEADVPEEFREVAFTRVLESLLNQAGGGKASGTRHGESRQSFENAEGNSDQESVDIVERLASLLSMDVTPVGRVYSEVDGEPHLNLASSRLPGTKAAATKDIALLIVLARQTLGIDDFTSVDEVRKIAEHFNKYDASNFAGTISGMSSVFRVQGKGQGRKLKLNQPGKESAIELVKKYGGAEG